MENRSFSQEHYDGQNNPYQNRNSLASHHQNKNRSNSSSPDMNRPPYHSFERSQQTSMNKVQRKPSLNDGRSTMESILRGQAKFAAEERKFQSSAQPWMTPSTIGGFSQSDGYSLPIQQSRRGSIANYDGIQSTSGTWPEGGLQIIAPEMTGITSSSSSFISNYDRTIAPTTLERNGRYASSSFSGRSPRPDMNTFSSGSVEYMPSAYSRDELYPFSPKPSAWPSVQPNTPSGFSAKSPNTAKQQRNTTPLDGFIYQVQFKRAHKNYILSPSAPRDIIPGDFVKVEADRGEDMGIVLAKIPVEDFEEVIPTAGYRGRGFSSGQGEKKYLFRLATPEERTNLQVKVQEEERALETIREKVLERGYPMQVLDAEYQFDRHKLTFYFEAERRIDFRELVSELFSQYKTRIWMQQVDTSSIAFHDAGTELAKATGFLPDRGDDFHSKRSSFSQGDDTSKDNSIGGSASVEQDFHCGYNYLDEPFHGSGGNNRSYVEYYDRNSAFGGALPEWGPTTGSSSSARF